MDSEQRKLKAAQQRPEQKRKQSQEVLRHLFLFGPTGSGKSATLHNILNQVTAIYRPRLFIVEAGNSLGLFGEFAERLGLSMHRLRLAPAPASAWHHFPTPVAWWNSQSKCRPWMWMRWMKTWR